MGCLHRINQVDFVACFCFSQPLSIASMILFTLSSPSWHRISLSSHAFSLLLSTLSFLLYSTSFLAVFRPTPPTMALPLFSNESLESLEWGLLRSSLSPRLVYASLGVILSSVHALKNFQFLPCCAFVPQRHLLGDFLSPCTEAC
jgi:hypothetical protein